MSAAMLTRALAAGLFDRPPNFALSRVYSVLATGAVAALLNPLSTVVSVAYGPGQPASPTPAFPIPGGGSATALGMDDLEPDRFAANALAASLFFGPFAPSFFTGIGGMIEYFEPAVGFQDFYTPTATGFGTLAPGGLVLNPDAVFQAMWDAAVAAEIMVVVLGVHVDDPNGTIPDPTTGFPLGVGDLFVQASILLRAVSTTFAAELLLGKRLSIPVVGSFLPPPVPPIAGGTITTVLF
jgi:hypothetical protein